SLQPDGRCGPQATPRPGKFEGIPRRLFHCIGLRLVLPVGYMMQKHHGRGISQLGLYREAAQLIRKGSNFGVIPVIAGVSG
ncbi:MAG: hypothetical protein KDA76_18360, partial [Planctomycetaceae bacterium]|nr:hypothetical protein [Planctomycetaceae bacterium]